MTLELPRRKFLLGLGAFIASPAVVKASSLMPVRAYSQGIVIRGNSLLLIEQITRDAVRLFTNSNKFIDKINREYELQYIASVRLPTNIANWHSTYYYKQ